MTGFKIRLANPTVAFCSKSAVGIPIILAASTTAAATEFGLERVSAFEAGMYNFHSWALLAVVITAIATGWGRRAASTTP